MRSPLLLTELEQAELKSLLQKVGCWHTVELLLIEALLEKYKYNRTHAAKAMNMSLRTLRIKIRQFEEQPMN